MTCRDCLGFNSCIFHWTNGEAETCRHFKNKSDFIQIKHGYNATKMHPVDEFICSVCGFTCTDYIEIKYDVDGEYSYGSECEFDYCPRCGTKMDEEVE